MFPAEFHYVCRIVSDILESNGSSSMATVAQATRAPHAGVKMRKPVSGIAMGLITDNESGKLRSAQRHPRRRRPPRRHGLQGDRNSRRHHRHPDGHIKCDGPSFTKSSRKHCPGTRRTPPHTQPHQQRHTRTPPGLQGSRAPHRHHAHTQRAYRRSYRPGGKITQGIQEESGATVSIDEIEEGGHIEVAAPNRDAITRLSPRSTPLWNFPKKARYTTAPCAP